MWILEWLPNWVFGVIFFGGFLGLLATYALKFIPFLSTYRIPIQLLSVIALCFGTYMLGAIADNNAWLKKVKEVEAKVAKAEVESAKENIKIVEKVVKKLEIVRVQGNEVIKYVDREVVKYDTKFAPGGICELPKEFFIAHNDAAKERRDVK
jgi:membrane-bound ClpP family serine protease